MNASLARLGIVALALLLAWRIVHVNAVLYDDSGRPRLPVALAGGLSAAPPDREILRGMLRENPANAEALLMLGRVDEREANPIQARRAYQVAYELAPLDREVLLASAGFFLRQGEVADALIVLDRLVENFHDARERAFPVLANVLASRQYARAWDAIVARGPEWVGAFILQGCARRDLDPALLVPMFLKRVAAGTVSAGETGCLVNRLRAADRWDEAYQVWLNTLPRERLADVGFVFNGSFEHSPSGVGFDWLLARQPEREVGHAADIAQGAGAIGKRALRVSYNGKRQTGTPAAQYLVLPPGRYELGGFGRPSGMTAGRGVQWTLRCVSEGKPGARIAESERFTGSSEWRRFIFDVTVPETCRGQILQLEPVGASEGPAFVGGTVWFDDLLLRRRG